MGDAFSVPLIFIHCQESQEFLSKTNIKFANVKFNSKQTQSIGLIAKEILVYLQEHRNET